MHSREPYTWPQAHPRQLLLLLLLFLLLLMMMMMMISSSLPNPDDILYMQYTSVKSPAGYRGFSIMTKYNHRYTFLKYTCTIDIICADEAVW